MCRSERGGDVHLGEALGEPIGMIPRAPKAVTDGTHRPSLATTMINLQPSITTRMKEQSATTQIPPDFKQVRSYLRSIQQRAALGGFIEAGWTPAELAEFARQVFLAPGKTYPTAASYQYAMEKGADHPFALETLASLRKPGFTLPPFDRPVLKHYEWDDPQNPEHSAELKDDVETMAQLWRNREAARHDQPWPVEPQPTPNALWKKLFKLRIKYHSLDDALSFQGLSGYNWPYSENTGDTTNVLIEAA
jgi:hypothetical protein